MSTDAAVTRTKTNGHDIAGDDVSGSARGHLRPSRELRPGPLQHFRRPPQRAFTAQQRATTTLLYIGLTWKHGRLIEASLTGLGYLCQQLPDPDRRAFQLGKEYGNTGQCNPTYFSTGCLIQFLQGLEAQGLTRQQICERYVFITTGACGPCRFGMYEAEFRLALRNAGFEDFRVVLFQQHGLDQAGEEAGLHVNADFMLSLLMSAALADLVNDMAYQIRPYEVVPGTADEAVAASIEELATIMRDRGVASRAMIGSVLRWLPGGSTVLLLIRLSGWTRSRRLMQILEGIRQRFGRIEVDRCRPRPIVKTTGEFWAQTTEGDGNFGLLGFLEREGADVIPEPIGAWLPFSIHQAKVKVRDRLTLGEGPWYRRPGQSWGRMQSLARLVLADRLYARVWNHLRRALGNMPRGVPDQVVLRELADPYYNYRTGGGEGHLEIGKNIYYHSHRLCHMVLSLKPFGCLPSTQSDGAQSAVTSDYPEMVFLPIETSGEGEVNANSRVQMALGDIRQRARDELAYVLEWSGLHLEEVDAFVAQTPAIRQASYRVPKSELLVSVAANFICHVAYLMDRVQIEAPLDPAPARRCVARPGQEEPLLQIAAAERS